MLQIPVIQWPFVPSKVATFSPALPKYDERMRVIAARARANLALLNSKV